MLVEVVVGLVQTLLLMLLVRVVLVV